MTSMPLRKEADRRIVLAFAITISMIMFAGFARSYFLRGWFSGRVLPPVVQLHGAIMTAWIALFVTQVALVSKRRVDLHRKLGILGIGLAVTAFALGEFIVVRAIEHRFPDVTAMKSALLFIAFDGFNLGVFAALVFGALVLRKDSGTHKRLMMLALVTALPPALGRIAERIAPHYESIVVLALMVTTVCLCLLVDSRRHHRMHPALALGGAITITSSGVTFLAQMAT